MRLDRDLLFQNNPTEITCGRAYNIRQYSGEVGKWHCQWQPESTRQTGFSFISLESTSQMGFQVIYQLLRLYHTVAK